jgi:hypothetical protein
MVRYQLAGPDIVHEEFDGEIVILNLQSGQYFGLNDSGAALWTVVQAGGDPAGVSAEHGPVFAARLVELGLVVESGEPVEVVPAQAIDTAPKIEIYDDLSDLILADPIHDVDQDEGWPKLPEAN